MSLMDRVSKCCNATIMRCTGKEHPLDRTFYITTSWDQCSKCNEHWPEVVEPCACCGEGSEALIETMLGRWCKSCTLTYASDLMEKA